MAKSRSSKDERGENRYGAILAHIFERYYQRGMSEFEFERKEINESARLLNIVLPSNLGDLLYSFRFRSKMPVSITRTAAPGYEWVISLAGRAKYKLIQKKINRIVPQAGLRSIKIPDSTPEIVAAYSLTDEQALLAKIRYNRLIDLFLKITAYSLQNHLRTSIPGMGQIETDEVYVGISNTGQQFVIPVQVKGGKDQIGAVQIEQDLALCRAKYPNLTPRPIAVQFIKDGDAEVIVMLELSDIDGDIKIEDEKHYRLVPASDISVEELQAILSKK